MALERERERERKISKEFLIFGFWVSFLNIWGTYQDSFLKVICPSSQQWTHPPSHGELSRRGRGFEGDFGALHFKKLEEVTWIRWDICQIFWSDFCSLYSFSWFFQKAPLLASFLPPTCATCKRCLAARFTQFLPPQGVSYLMILKETEEPHFVLWNFPYCTNKLV